MIASRRRFLHAASTAAVATLLPSQAWATDRSKAERYQKPREGSDVDVGGAVVGVHRPLADVLKVTMNFRKYHQILPRIETSRLMSRHGDDHEVYMRAPIMRGMYSIWTITRFTGPLPLGRHGKLITGKMVRGNVEAFDGRWLLYPCSAKRTIVRLELYMIPKVPVPAAWITPELMWAADKGVTAVKTLAECGESSVKDD